MGIDVDRRGSGAFWSLAIDYRRSTVVFETQGSGGGGAGFCGGRCIVDEAVQPLDVGWMLGEEVFHSNLIPSTSIYGHAMLRHGVIDGLRKGANEAGVHAKVEGPSEFGNIDIVQTASN